MLLADETRPRRILDPHDPKRSGRQTFAAPETVPGAVRTVETAERETVERYAPLAAVVNLHPTAARPELQLVDHHRRLRALSLETDRVEEARRVTANKTSEVVGRTTERLVVPRWPAVGVDDDFRTERRMIRRDEALDPSRHEPLSHRALQPIEVLAPEILLVEDP